MAGNAQQAHERAALRSVVAVDAPEVMTSAAIDERLAPTLDRLGLRAGLLEEVAGIAERRWWPADVTFAEAAAQAGRDALAAAGIAPDEIGMLVSTAVCRDRLEPSMASEIHHRVGLPTSCRNFDLANACLGFVDAWHLAASLIDAGQIRYALIVDGEGSRYTQERTLERLARPDTTVADVFDEFATLTLGSGAAAAVLCSIDDHPDAHRIVRGVSRAGTSHHNLCVGDLERMRTDTRGLLEAGLDLAEAAWLESREAHDWTGMDLYVIHQVSQVHTAEIVKRLGLDPDRVPMTFPTRGNIGPASVPFTLAGEVDRLSPGDRVLCMGIGSGLNTAFTELTW